MSKTEKKLGPGEAQLKNPKQELFCWLYAGSHNRELFGNGTRCYIQVYFSTEIEKLRKEITDIESDREKGYTTELRAKENRIHSLEVQARTRAAELVANRGIKLRIDVLLNELVSSEFMDRELAFTAAQRNDLNSKVQAIKEYNRLKDRGASGRLEGTFVFGWEQPLDSKNEPRKKPVLKKATIKHESPVVWEGEKK